MFVRSMKQLNIDMIQRENKSKNKVPNNRNQRKNKEKKIANGRNKKLTNNFVGFGGRLGSMKRERERVCFNFLIIIFSEFNL